MRQMWLDFLMTPPAAQIALVGAVAFLASLCGLLLIIHGRRAWYAWRLEIWRRQHPNLWPDGPGGTARGGRTAASAPERPGRDSPRASPMTDRTHWWPADDDWRRRAICGAVVVRVQFSTDPTCPDCQRQIEEDARDLEALAAKHWDPAQLVKPQHFDPTAGYRPRRRRY